MYFTCSARHLESLINKIEMKTQREREEKPEVCTLNLIRTKSEWKSKAENKNWQTRACRKASQNVGNIIEPRRPTDRYLPTKWNEKRKTRTTSKQNAAAAAAAATFIYVRGKPKIAFHCWFIVRTSFTPVRVDSNAFGKLRAWSHLENECNPHCSSTLSVFWWNVIAFHVH